MLQNIVHLFYPQLCAACEQPLSTGNKVVCVSCRLQLPYLSDLSLHENIITKMFWGRVPVEAGISLFYFQKQTIVQDLLHALKYRNRKDVAETFGHELGTRLNTAQEKPAFDLVVPVPMHRSKYKKRGYNQSELIASSLSEVTGIPMGGQVLKKVSATNSQTKKGRMERWTNSEEQFTHTGQDHQERILLVDDVITTGATIEACSQAILKARPQSRISVATLAVTYR